MTTADASTGGTGPIFDVHLHALPAALIELAISEEATGDPALLRRVYTEPVAGDEQLAETLARMDREGVRQAMLSGNETLVRRWTAVRPERFLPAFTPDLDHPDPAAQLAQFERELRDGYWKGLGELLLPYFGRPLNDPALFPYYALCEAAGVPVQFHTGTDGEAPQRHLSSRFRISLSDPLLLEDIAIRFPRLRVVMAHLGWPFVEHMLYLLRTYSTFYVDTGFVAWGLPPRLFRRALRDAVDLAPDRVLFGSDQMAWPHLIASAARRVRGAEGFSDEELHRVLHDNAALLFQLAPP
jgi:uncharacterized protein